MVGARNSIRNLIDTYGSTVTITLIIITKDKWGDKTETPGAPTTMLAIPYDILPDKFNFQPVGDISEGDVVMIIRDDETTVFLESAGATGIRTKLTYESIDYDIISFEDYDLSGITLAKQIILRKRD